MRALAALFFVSLSSLLALPTLAEAQRASIELAFDHGISQLREPGEDVDWTGAHAALDLRVHSPLGMGGMLRAGTTFGALVTLELDAGPTYRSWLFRQGPRGLTLTSSLGGSMFWNTGEPDARIRTTLAGGLYVDASLDYHEHGFLVGIGYHGRWLPVSEGSDQLDTFSFSATARVGGEIEL